MPAQQELARQWFIPGDGIDRHVISADIQRYLGNDATVRPGRGTERNNEGVEGYWIRAYRNLTSAMISDLRADSARWRQEKAATGGRGSSSPSDSNTSGITVPDLLPEPYVGSQTYERGNASQSVRRRDADSPSLGDGAYGVPPTRSGRGQGDAMQIDPPAPQQHADRGRYGQPSHPTRGGYQTPDSGAYPAPGRDRYPDNGRAEPGRPTGGRPAYQEDQTMSDAYGRPPVSQAFGQDTRYGAPPPANDGAPPGYVRQGDYFVPVSGYGQPNVMTPTSRPEPQQYIPGYGQPVEPQRDARGGRGDIRGDPRGVDPRDPRYGQGDYDASRYYPSPATTAASVNTRETISSPPVQSQYGGMPVQYDQYGRPVQQPGAPYGAPEPVYAQTRETRDTREPAYGRQAPPVAGGDRDRDTRRRRLH
ncbi:uncharacterized protein LTR77_004845 [Saxophila tyrrhenica]|uniref:Uncharacterized protein n=1 Tax=Saxophila tyrrhenica TaxID=1690608 RepID=A0AAV9PAK1_9PEZI|nr:hypothetical protein LTR77_004845 [Saxophila tyrrhenica]